MSYLTTVGDDITAARFFRSRPIHSLNLPGLKQTPQSRAGSSQLSTESAAYIGRGDVCLVRGEVDISQEWAHFVPAIRDTAPARVQEKEKILELIKSKWRLSHADFTLEDHENMALLSLPIHRHHDSYSTIFISACLHDVLLLTAKCKKDNLARQKLIDDGHLDPGRAHSHVLWEPTPLEKFQRTFELVVLRPSHFLINGEPMSTYRDRVRTSYYSHPGGLLRDEHDNIFPPFPCGVRHYLNPLFVNLAAVLRVRRFKRLNGGRFPPTFHPHACALMDAVLALHEEIIFTPKPNIPARERYLRLLRLRNDVRSGGGGGSSADGGGGGGDETGGSGNDHPVGMEGIESAGLPAQGSTRLPLSQRIASGDFDGDEFDQIFGGNNFLDLPALYDEDDDNDDSFSRPSTPVISVNEKIEGWLVDSSAGQDSNGSNCGDCGVPSSDVNILEA